MRLKVYQTILDQAMVPLAYVADVDKAKKVVDACYNGGLRSFEFTNRGVGAHKVFDKLAEHCRANYPDMMLGIGSVVEAPTAGLYIQLGPLHPARCRIHRGPDHRRRRRPGLPPPQGRLDAGLLHPQRDR